MSHDHGGYITIRPQVPSSHFGPDRCYRFQFIQAHFKSERLYIQVGSRQLLGSRLQERTLSDIDGSVEDSLRERHAFPASG
jgi:hypothetical protein